MIVCAPLRSNVNLSRIARAAGCCGVNRLISIGPAKLDPKIARDAVTSIKLEIHRSIEPLLDRLRNEQYRLVGLEQASRSVDIHSYEFQQKTVLVVGNEREGLSNTVLRHMDDVVEIPVWGLPHSYNAATATAMALYEYCRQYPDG